MRKRARRRSRTARKPKKKRKRRKKRKLQFRWRKRRKKVINQMSSDLVWGSGSELGEFWATWMRACVSQTAAVSRRVRTTATLRERRPRLCSWWVDGFNSSVQFPGLLVDFASFDFSKRSCFLLFRRSAPRLNVEVGAVPRAAPGPAAARARRP